MLMAPDIAAAAVPLTPALADAVLTVARVVVACEGLASGAGFLAVAPVLPAPVVGGAVTALVLAGIAFDGAAELASLHAMNRTAAAASCR